MSDTIRGTPGPIFMPAKRWEWRHLEGPFTIDVPGTLALAGDEGKKSCSINLKYASDIDVWVDMGVLTKSLFSASAYPKLEDNQVFSISSIIFDETTDVVTVVGNVLEKV